MSQAVASPSGSAFRLNYLPVAVKTGTAETGKEDVYHNWISLFAPYDDPEIIMVIIVENVKGTRIVAQNIAAEVLEWYFRD